jgi:hypothetical protein
VILELVSASYDCTAQASPGPLKRQRLGLSEYENSGSEVTQCWPFWVFQRWCEVPPLYPHTPAMCAQPVVETPWGGSVQGQRGCSALEPPHMHNMRFGGRKRSPQPSPARPRQRGPVRYRLRGSRFRPFPIVTSTSQSPCSRLPLRHSVRPPASLALADCGYCSGMSRPSWLGLRKTKTKKTALARAADATASGLPWQCLERR